MKEYFGEGWREILAINKLDGFDKLWNLKAEWFEEPNIRRGGWSGVARLELKQENGKSVGVFLKRQENHFTKTIAHPVKGIPTFEREFNNIQRFRTKKLHTVEPVYFGKRKMGGKIQAVLVSKALTGYESLDSVALGRCSKLMSKRVCRERLIQGVAEVMREMHKHHFQHNCFYSKHVFAKQHEAGWEIKIIDLEKLKWRLFKRDAVYRDLYTLHRHAADWSKSDRLRFLKTYMQEDRLSSDSKLIWRSIEKKIRSKQKS